MDCKDMAKALPHMPPSTESVLCALNGHNPMTGAELQELTHLPRRTVYEALRQLRAFGVLKERPSLRDTRQTYFWLAGQDPPMNKLAQPPSKFSGMGSSGTAVAGA